MRDEKMHWYTNSKAVSENEKAEIVWTCRRDDRGEHGVVMQIS